MAFAGDDKAVPGGQVRDVIAADRVCNVTTSMEPCSWVRPPPSCPAFDAEEFSDPGPPLVRERLPVH
jgi:hypothetical protein